ncbi:CinA family nicotinamide mononucleotide deamidase-related protein [Bacteroidales bacterium]
MLTASILTIGDEILIGQIVDSNKSYISGLLNLIGVKVITHQSTGDEEFTIKSSVANLLKESDIVIITGGLGPTKDDITKKVLGEISGSKTYKLDKNQLDIIKAICLKRGIELSALNEEQALVPENCTVLENKQGTAPGMMFEIDGRLLFSLPGVPYEMQHLMKEVLNKITNLRKTERISHKTINTFGIPESELATKISDWEDSLPSNYKLAYLPNPARGVKLRLSVYQDVDNSTSDKIKQLFKQLYTIIGDSIYGEDEDTLETVVSKALSERGETLSLAESCTGGEISSIFTSLPGASSIFKGGVVAYDNEAKTAILGVDKSIIERFGAVSEECVIAMAEGAKRLFGSDWSIATSGIAGPGGGSEEKPVGTVWIAISGPGVITTNKAIFSGDRERNIIRFSSNSINLLRKAIGIPLPF